MLQLVTALKWCNVIITNVAVHRERGGRDEKGGMGMGMAGGVGGG